MSKLEKFIKEVEEKDFEFISNNCDCIVNLEDLVDETDKEKFKNSVATDLVYKYNIELDNNSKYVDYRYLPEEYEEEFSEKYDEILSDYIFEKTALGEDVYSKEDILYRLNNLNEYDLRENIKFIKMIKSALNI